jgi:general secretion pathway protein G
VVRAAERGMTLLEIMVVLVIIGLIAGIIGVNVLGQLEEANVKTASTQIKQIGAALDLYKLSFRTYPSTGEGLQALVTPKGNAQPFMKEIPKDPWDRDFVYIYPGTNNAGGFDLMSYGKDGVQGGGDDVTNWSQPSAN